MESKNLNEFIKYLEITSFFHDIGKISSHFLLSKDRDLNIKDNHAILILEEKLPHNLEKFLKTPLNKIFLDFEGLEDGISPINFICAHHGCERCKFSNGCSKFENNFYIKLLQISDRMDSSNPPNSGKQPFYSVYISDFFLNVKKINFYEIDFLRKKYLTFLDLFILNLDREKIFKISKHFMEKALSETRKGANDITLYTHSKAISSIFKTILFDYFYFGIEVPKSIFDVETKFLKTKRGYKKLIEEILSFGNLIFKFENYEYFIVGKGVDKLFLKMNGIDGELVNSIKINKSEKRYFYPIDPEKLLETIFVKIPQDLDLKFEDLLSGAKEIINYGRSYNLNEIKNKIKGVKKHIRNLIKGGKLKESEKKKKELKKLLSKMNYLLKFKNLDYNLTSIEKFLMKTLAPIRPPSISKFSMYILDLMRNKKLNINELAFEVFLKKPLTISRIIQYNLDLKKYKDINEIPKFNGKVKYSNKNLKERYYEIKKIEIKNDIAIVKLSNKKELKIPITTNGKEIDKLNLYFIGKVEREGELIFPLGKGKSLIHITELKEKDRIKLIL
jgi:hypothetical protein